MNDGLLRVNFGNMADGQNSIIVAKNKLAERLAELTSDGNRLTEGWEGTARDAYLARQKEWTDAAERLKGVLIDFGSAVGSANDAYRTTENNATKRFGG